MGAGSGKPQPPGGGSGGGGSAGSGSGSGAPGPDESFFAAAAAAPLNPVWNQEPWAATLLDNARQFGVQLVCAGGSGAAAKTVVAPLERAKILAQVQSMAAEPPRYTGPWDALWRMRTAEGGWRVWFRGNGANVIRLVPEVGFKFAVHDQFRVMFSPPDGSPMGVQEKMAAGAATGVCKTLLFYPLDFCRTRITAHTSFAAPPPAAAAAAAAAGAKAGEPLAAAAAAARRRLWTLAAPAAGPEAWGHGPCRHAAAAAAAGRLAGPSAIGGSSGSGSGSSSSSSGGSNSSSSRFSSSNKAGSGGSGAPPGSAQGLPLNQQHHRRALHAAPTPQPLPPPPPPAAPPGVLCTLRGAVAREGLLAPYRGMLLSLPGVVVYTSVSFTAYDTFKRLLPADKNSREAFWYPFAKMGCGAAAGVAAQTCSFPLDTLRRRMQMAGAPGAAASAAAGPGARPARVGYAALLRALAAAPEGLVRGLFRGWTVNCVKIVPGAAVQFVAYDALRVGVTWLDPTSGAQSPL